MTSRELSGIRQLFVTQEPMIDSEMDSLELLDLIQRTPAEEILSLIKQDREHLRPISAANIPQLSNPDDIYKVLRVVIDSGMKDLDFTKIGYHLRPRGTKPGALRKYGENHYKYAADLGLVTEEQPFIATDLGLAFYLIEDSEKRLEIHKKLVLRVPIIQQAILMAEIEMVDMTAIMSKYLSPSTVTRRRSNVRKALSYVMAVAGVDLQHTLNNIVWR